MCNPSKWIALYLQHLKNSSYQHSKAGIERPSLNYNREVRDQKESAFLSSTINSSHMWRTSRVLGETKLLRASFMKMPQKIFEKGQNDRKRMSLSSLVSSKFLAFGINFSIHSFVANIARGFDFCHDNFLLIHT